MPQRTGDGFLQTLRYVYAKEGDVIVWFEYPPINGNDTNTARVFRYAIDDGFFEKYCVVSKEYIDKLDQLVNTNWEKGMTTKSHLQSTGVFDQKIGSADVLLTTQCMELILDIRTQAFECMQHILADHNAILPLVGMNNKTLHPADSLVYDTDRTFINDKLPVIRIATGTDPVPHSVRLNRQLMVSSALGEKMRDSAQTVTVEVRLAETNITHVDHLRLVGAIGTFGPMVPLEDVIQLMDTPGKVFSKHQHTIDEIEDVCMRLVAQYAITFDVLTNTLFVQQLDTASTWQPLIVEGAPQSQMTYRDRIKKAVSNIDRRVLASLKVAHESTDAMRQVLYTTETLRMEIYRRMLHLLHPNPFDHTGMRNVREMSQERITEGLIKLVSRISTMNHIAVVIYLEYELIQNPHTNPHETLLRRLIKSNPPSTEVWDTMRNMCTSSGIWDKSISLLDILNKVQDLPATITPGFLHALWMARLDPLRAQSYSDYHVQNWVAHVRGAPVNGVLGALAVSRTVVEFTLPVKWVVDTNPCLVHGLDGYQVRRNQWLCIRRPDTNIARFICLHNETLSTPLQFDIRLLEYDAPGQIIACLQNINGIIVIRPVITNYVMRQIIVQVYGVPLVAHVALLIKPMIRSLPFDLKGEQVVHVDLVNSGTSLYYVLFLSTMAIVLNLTTDGQLTRCRFEQWKLCAITSNGDTYACMAGLQDDAMVVFTVSRTDILDVMLTYKRLAMSAIPFRQRSALIRVAPCTPYTTLQTYQSFATGEVILATITPSTLRKDRIITVFRLDQNVTEIARLHADELPVHLERTDTEYLLLFSNGTWRSSLNRRHVSSDLVPGISVLALLVSTDDRLVVISNPDKSGCVLVKMTHR